MLKARELIGSKIVALESGERVESVHDLVFDEQGNQLLALLVDEGGWFRGARVVPFQDIRSFGEDAIMIGSVGSVVNAQDDGVVSDALHSKKSLVGLNLLTTDGKDLGRIADVFFDETSGHVVGYEATGGLFSDLSAGRTFVPAPDSITIGVEAAIVPVTVAAAMEEQPAGGLQGAFQSAGESLSGAAGSVAEGVRSAAGTVSENVRSAADSVSDAARERQKAFVVGKVASRDVAAESGSVLVHSGETITALHAQQAEQLGLLGALTVAAGGGALQEAYSSAREQTQQGVSTARTTIVEHYENLADASAERQREFVIGRMAGADVVTPDGLVVARRGEVIGDAQALLAQDHGMLATLVAAATSGQVQQSTQVIRAQVQEAGESVREHFQPSPARLIGRRVLHDVYGPQRSFIAAQGQIVTEAVLNRARFQGREAELEAAVEGNAAPTSGSSLQDGVQVAGDRLAAGAQTVREGATGLLDRARSWISETRDRVSEDAEEHQILEALGRPVNRVVLDRQDNIILNAGEIVTHKAVEQARAAGLLDLLLSSVSTETVMAQTPVVPVMPTEPGSAALTPEAPVTPAQPSVVHPAAGDPKPGETR
ncbi:PRC-barrel domain-containing protein [Deinococcus sonorensis]|uniref:PRC-barrel domain-containing protein n=2 Tax=Deinococcus sonorensis TaxID=309891 RepID=A0AAU7U8W9_9DEIO